MPILPLPLAFGAAATPALFGANILAPRTTMTGPGSYAEAVETLGVTTLRYPGGALTESYFDISDPDAATVIDNETGARSDFMPLSDIMEYSAQTGAPVSIVIPTRQELSRTAFDDNGDRFADVDEDALRDFVRDVVTGTYGDGQVASFEIGNEYWGSGRMNAVEYGRVAAEMTRIVDDELRLLAADHPEAAQVDILVQMGTNFGESSLDEAYDGMTAAEIAEDLNATYGLDLRPGARIDWTDVNNRIVIEQFDMAELDAVDGIVAHVYSRGPEAEHTRYFHLDQIEDSWQAVDPSLEIHVTEWNLRSGAANLVREQDYGLYQAQEMLEQVEAFMAEGVDAAQVWPLIQNSASALSIGQDFTGATPPGEMFSMMSDNLPGMTMLDFTPAEPRDSELETGGMEVHGFADGADMLFYITAPQGGGVLRSGVDIGALVAGVGGVEASVLGVAPGQSAGDTGSDPRVEQLDGADVYADGMIDVLLGPGEIMQVRLTEVTPTASFSEAFEATTPESAAPDPEILDDALLFEPEPLEAGAAQPSLPAGPPSEVSAPSLPPELAALLGYGDTTDAADPTEVTPFPADPLSVPASGASDLPMPWQEIRSEEAVSPAGLSGPAGAAFPPEIAAPARAAREATTPAQPEEAAQELMTLLGFRESGPGEPESLGAHSAPADEADDLHEEDEADDSGTFDDMGLGWALALMPLLALAGVLG